MKKVLVFVIFTAVFLIAAGSLSAQSNAQELRFGAHANGKIINGREVWYRITPNQDGIMVIEVTSGEFDTYLEVYDSNNKLLNENDDGGSDTDSKLEMHGAKDATYLVKVRGYDSNENGAFRISASYKPIPRATELRFGVSRSANLFSGDEHWYSVRTTRAGMVIVETGGDDIDTYLEAYNNAYKLLDADDDGGEELNARILLMAEANQTYLFKLKAFDEDEEGQYQIIARMYVEAN